MPRLVPPQGPSSRTYTALYTASIVCRILRSKTGIAVIAPFASAFVSLSLPSRPSTKRTPYSLPRSMQDSRADIAMLQRLLYPSNVTSTSSRLKSQHIERLYPSTCVCMSAPSYHPFSCRPSISEHNLSCNKNLSENYRESTAIPYGLASSTAR